MKYFKKFLLNPLEGFFIVSFYTLLKILPIRTASFFMGKLARLIGPLLPVSYLGLKNLRIAFPQKSTTAYKKIVKDVWENLGRVVGEFPHVEKLSSHPKYVTIVNAHIIEDIKNDNKAGIFFSAHMANWELPHLTVVQHGLPLWLISRPPNNPLTRLFLQRVRENPMVRIILKGSQGSKELIRILLQKEHVGLLLDQRLSEGEKIPFFGKPALTAIGPAKLAHKFDIPLIPVQVERTNGCCFKITFHPPLALGTSPKETTLKINHMLEEWISKNPGQWLWFHNRWRD